MGVVLMVVYGLIALVWRSVSHRRRTGDSGSRLAATTRGGKVAAALMVAAHGLALVGAFQGATASISSLLALTGMLVFAGGLVLVVAAQGAMGASWRVGVDPNERTELVTTGLFTTLRNPIFSGMTLCLTGVALTSASWIAAIAVAVFVIGIEVQVRLVEEPYLLRVHGASFTAYLRRTGRFVPRGRPSARKLARP